jgi:hypothetical protein
VDARSQEHLDDSGAGLCCLSRVDLEGQNPIAQKFGAGLHAMPRVGSNQASRGLDDEGTVPGRGFEEASTGEIALAPPIDGIEYPLDDFWLRVDPAAAVQFFDVCLSRSGRGIHRGC